MARVDTIDAMGHF